MLPHPCGHFVAPFDIRQKEVRGRSCDRIFLFSVSNFLRWSGLWWDCWGIGVLEHETWFDGADSHKIWTFTRGLTLSGDSHSGFPRRVCWQPRSRLWFQLWVVHQQSCCLLTTTKTSTRVTSCRNSLKHPTISGDSNSRWLAAAPQIVISTLSCAPTVSISNEHYQNLNLSHLNWTFTRAPERKCRLRFWFHPTLQTHLCREDNHVGAIIA